MADGSVLKADVGGAASAAAGVEVQSLITGPPGWAAGATSVFAGAAVVSTGQALANAIW